MNIIVDWKIVYSKNYKRQTEDLATTNIDLTEFTPGTHTITIQAMDANWNMNHASITDVLEATDNEPPYLVTDQSKKQDVWDWQYKVTLVFDDRLSWIPGGSVSVWGNVVTSFQWRLATFTTSAESFDVDVKDNFWNVLHQTINVIDL